MTKIIDVDKINSLLDSRGNNDKINEILNKALQLKGLTLEETAILMNIEDEKTLEKVFHCAKQLKEKIYGNRIVLFAPLYASNICSNNCAYCAFRRDNKQIQRCHLTPDEVVEEAKAIIKLGHKRIVLLTGEDYVHAGLDYLEEIMIKIYEAKVFNGEIRRININIAPLSVEDFKRLNTFGIGTYQLFQETYHPDVYKEVHLGGKKMDYNWRLEAMDRAIEAGISDVGIGPLFGLANFKFETLATLMHAQHLDNKYGIGPHTISVPRIEPAQGVTFSENPPEPVDNLNFKKIIAVLRLAVPYTGLILSTREAPAFRRELLELGISQISAESKVNPGGYFVHKDSSNQFTTSDNRTLDEVVRELAQGGFIPSFCTACYRSNRIGKNFMDIAKVGHIHNFCEPNAIATFAEYLNDYASEETKNVGFEAIENHIKSIDNDKIKQLTQSSLNKVNAGERDVYI